MRVLLTGATGFVGRQTVEACRECGHEVGALVMPDDPTALPGYVTRYEGTLEQPPWDEIEAFAPQVCIHSAWITTPGVYMTSPLNASFEAWSRAFLARLLTTSVRRVIGVGTCIEYLPAESDQSQAPYVQCKTRLRAFLEEAAQEGGVSTVWARIFFPFGVGEPPGKLCRTIIETLRKGERFSIYCPGAVRDYIAVQDVGRALAQLVDSPATGDIDVGSGIPVTVRDVAVCIARAMGRDPDACFEWGDQPDALTLPIADTTRLRATGWAPAHSLQEGVKRLVEALRGDKRDG